MSDTSEPRPKVALLSILLEKRKLGWVMLGGGLVYFLISLTGIPLVTCSFKETTGYDCPGCGLTRSSTAILHGDWQTAFSYHWFAPVFMVFWAAVGLGLVLPEPWRGKFLNVVRKSERVTWWPVFLGIGLVIYALTRNVVGG